MEQVGPEILNTAYKLFCEETKLKKQNRINSNKINYLEKYKANQEIEIYALETRADQLKNNLTSGLKNIDKFEDKFHVRFGFELEAVKDNISKNYRNILGRIKALFNKNVRLLPQSSESIDKIGSEIRSQCGTTRTSLTNNLPLSKHELIDIKYRQIEESERDNKNKSSKENILLNI